MERRLTAILCADVHGYSRLMGQNERATLASLTSCRKIIDSLIEGHRGRFVNSAGDSVLAEFASVVNAVECAVEIQTALKTENASLPPERRMEFRIGVNLGDVMVEGEQIYGDGVNVAARLESLAAAGGICVSGKVYDEVAGKLDLSYQDLGAQRVKNIAEPVRVFRVLPEAGTSRIPATNRGRARRLARRGGFSLAGVGIVIATIVLVQHLSLKPPHTSASIPTPGKPSLVAPDKPSIAVLPFTNLSGDPKQDYFSDGITDYLITDLSRLNGLLVIARNSTFAYKGKAITVQQIGRELGVRTVLEGSVFKAPSEVRITVDLADASTGANLWATRFDQPLKDVFTVQDQIVREIVTTLKLLSKAHDLQFPPTRVNPTNNLEAFDYWLRGNEEMDATKEGYLRWREMFEKAIALDPNYADAYASLATNYILALMVQYDKDPKTQQHIVELAQRALALDDANWNAYMVLGEHYGLERQYDRAIAYDRHAIAIDPNNPITYYWLGDVLTWAGKPAEAFKAEETAIRLDPHNADLYAINIGWAYSVMGQYAKALPFLLRHAKRYPDNIYVHFALAETYAELGRSTEARAEGAEIMRLNPQFSLRPQPGAHCPFKDEAVCQREEAALRKAGLK
jgi:adenylate cyclase